MNKIKLIGFDKLGYSGNEGTRYSWSVDNNKHILESASFYDKTKGVTSDIAGYTTSVSLGCVLRHFGYACKFCRTGNLIPFARFLSAKEITKQNVLMVLADMYNSEHINAKSKKREFAYMGQGEPGYSYSQLRLAIKMTDYIMKEFLQQEVYRHIIATSGVPEMLYALASDLKNNYYDSRITLHYSLHAAKNRELIMPINKYYKFEDMIDILKYISYISKEKVCLGILLFNEFCPKNSSEIFSTNISDLKSLFDLIDVENFRFSFCEYNDSAELGKSSIFSNEDANNINDLFRTEGYDTKLFFSFGREEQSACGMLAGKVPLNKVLDEWEDLESQANIFVDEAWRKVI